MKVGRRRGTEKYKIHSLLAPLVSLFYSLISSFNPCLCLRVPHPHPPPPTLTARTDKEDEEMNFLTSIHLGMKASSMLAQAFSAARSNLSSNDGSQNDKFGMNSKVASVIREFTEPFRQDDDYEDDEEESEHMNTINTHPMLLVEAADNSKGLPPTIRRCFSHEMKMGEDVVKDMVGQTSGFMPRDIRELVVDASSSLIPINGNSFENLGDSKEFMVKDLERSKKRNASALGTPKVPNVMWEDVGGLEDVKKCIIDIVQMPKSHQQQDKDRTRTGSYVVVDNDDFLSSESDIQMLLIRQKYEELDELSASVEWIGSVGLTIHDELLSQEKIIEDVGSEMESTSNRLDFVQVLIALATSFHALQPLKVLAFRLFS
ncbi:unnamed protein product [Lactuca saligna]|uniref:t-SNARE coiled-coil homology domain-containing protein n=1 Tax=Lactuca saligna TaxID=75948 RepID=A0AA35YWJ6_LACSI|nr:unnamed protein product [Lactuca saligna]